MKMKDKIISIVLGCFLCIAILGLCFSIYYKNEQYKNDITQAVVIVNNNAVLMDITAVERTGGMYIITTADGLKISSAPENVYFIHGAAEESDSFKALCYGGNVK